MIAQESGARVSHVSEAAYESVTQAIVASIASLEGCKRTEVPELFGASEPDALDALFAVSEASEALTVELELGDYLVECEKSGAVTARRKP